MRTSEEWRIDEDKEVKEETGVKPKFYVVRVDNTSTTAVYYSWENIFKFLILLELLYGWL